MAEAIALLGVAAASAQFLQFGVEALRICKEIRDSGATDANRQLETYVEELKGIRKALPGVTGSTAGSRRINDLGVKCEKAGDELFAVLQQVRGASSGRASTFRESMRAMKGKRTIEKLAHRLQDYQTLLDQAMSANLRLKVQQIVDDAVARHTEHKDLLLQLSTSAAAQHTQLRSDIDEARTKTRDQLSQLAIDTAASHDRMITGSSAIRGDIVAAETVHRRDRFLDSLRFVNMTSREESIKPAWATTYEWIFDETYENRRSDVLHLMLTNESPPRVTITQWLHSDESTYWISGKAGSGKSTLMGFVNDDSRFDAALRAWAGSEAYIKVTFFFWRAGSSLQKSITGLLRSILHQLCCVRSDILNEVAASFDGVYAWTETKLLAAVRRALETLQQVRVVMMIDGLDELEGDHDRLIDVLSDIVRGTTRKLCIASRPETVLTHRLSSMPGLRLDDLNLEDITWYVEDKLFAVSEVLRNNFAREVVKKSSGVFIWAVLVTKSMTDGHKAGDDNATLHERLSQMPTEIHALVASMIESVDALHRDALAFYFRAMCCFDEANLPLKLSVATIAAAMSDKPSQSLDDLVYVCGQTRTQILARSKGLIDLAADQEDAQIVSGTNVLSSYETQCLCWLHRSAYDYVFKHPESPLTAWVEACDEVETVEKLLTAQVDLVRLTSTGCSWYDSKLGSLIHTAIALAKYIRERASEVTDKALDGMRDALERRHDGRLVNDELADATLPSEEWLPLEQLFSATMCFWTECIVFGPEAYVCSRMPALTKQHHTNVLCASLVMDTAYGTLVHSAHDRTWLDFFADTVQRLKTETYICFGDRPADDVRHSALGDTRTMPPLRQVVRSTRSTFRSANIRREAQILYYLCRALALMFSAAWLPEDALLFESSLCDLNIWEPFMPYSNLWTDVHPNPLFSVQFSVITAADHRLELVRGIEESTITGAVNANNLYWNQSDREQHSSNGASANNMSCDTGESDAGAKGNGRSSRGIDHDSRRQLLSVSGPSQQRRTQLVCRIKSHPRASSQHHSIVTYELIPETAEEIDDYCWFYGRMNLCWSVEIFKRVQELLRQDIWTNWSGQLDAWQQLLLLNYVRLYMDHVFHIEGTRGSPDCPHCGD
nr:hypothetical protein B0A51_07018 [Rachicladosporium sp. CCFEE 5018]